MTQIILPAGSEIQSGNATFNEGNQFMKKVSSADVDMTVVGQTELYTVPTGKYFLPIMWLARLKTWTEGTRTDQIQMTMGTNDPDYNDMLGNQSIGLPDLATVSPGLYTFQWFGVDGTAVPFTMYRNTAGQVIKWNNQQDTGADAEVWTVELWGIVENV